jgi:hypothetical protein
MFPIFEFDQGTFFTRGSVYCSSKSWRAGVRNFNLGGVINLEAEFSACTEGKSRFLIDYSGLHLPGKM